jgi:hypothetical protein
MFLLAGCVTEKAGTSQTSTMSQVAAAVAQAAATAPELATQLDDVYAFLVAQKAVPDNTAEATKALAALDVIAPLVQKGAEALQGDNLNWAQFAVQSAVTVAKVMGYVLPLVL